MKNQTVPDLGKHFNAFVDEQLASGRYDSVNEVIRAGLRLLEDNEKQLDRLRQLIEVGDREIENGEYADYSLEAMRAELLSGN